jgi:hypothetical protein
VSFFFSAILVSADLSGFSPVGASHFCEHILYYKLKLRLFGFLGLIQNAVILSGGYQNGIKASIAKAVEG